MNSKKGVKSCVPDRVSISCPTCGTRHDLHEITIAFQYSDVPVKTIPASITLKPE